MAENKERNPGAPAEPNGEPRAVPAQTGAARAEDLREIIEALERIFTELDAVREQYKALLQTDFDATVSDTKSVKSLLKKYSQLIP